MRSDDWRTSVDSQVRGAVFTERPRWHHALEDRVVLQDRLMQAPEILARLQAEIVQQNATRLPVDLERVRLTPRAIQREHHLSPQPLPQRMLVTSP